MKLTEVKAAGGLPRIPDYKIYKWERIPELAEVQKRLQVHGLKDPWIRNEVWRYHPGFGTYYSNARLFFLRGFVPGVILAFVTWQCQKYYLSKHPDFYNWHDPTSNVGSHHGGSNGHEEQHGHGH